MATITQDMRYRLSLIKYDDKIVFIDENSGLTDEDIDKIKKNHIVIGFM